MPAKIMQVPSWPVQSRASLRFVAADCRERIEADSMNSGEQFCDSTCADQIHIAERELSAFIRAVTQLFGPEEAKLSAEDWLDQSEIMDDPPRSTSRNWRAVTIAASARLANRLAAAPHRRSDRLDSLRQGFAARRAG
jgi:hypothetical protein